MNMDIFNKNNTSRAVDIIGTQNLVIDNFLKSITKLISNVVVKVKMASNSKSIPKETTVFLRPIDSVHLRQKIKDLVNADFNIDSQNLKKSLNEFGTYIDEINCMSSDQQLLKDFKTASIIIRFWYQFFEDGIYLSVDGQSISRISVDSKLMIDVLTSGASAQYLINLSN